MNIVMIMSQDRLNQEHAMLNRIVVGFANDGNQVVRIVPSTPNDELTPFEKAVSLAKRITTAMPVSLLLRKVRCEEIVQQLEKIDVDVIIAFGKDAQQVAFDVAPHLNAPIFKEVISMQEAKRVRKSSRVYRWLAATPSIERAIANRVGEERVFLVPLAASSTQAPIQDSLHKNCCITVLGASENPKSTKQILEAIKPLQETHLFLELKGRHQHKVWKLAEQLSMLDRVTFLDDMASLRSLVTKSDLVLIPSVTMPIRTILLEVMLASIPIIAASIEGFDMLIDDETAIIIHDGNWEESIKKVLEDTKLATRITQAATKLISEQYASSAQIAAFEHSFTLI